MHWLLFVKACWVWICYFFTMYYFLITFKTTNCKYKFVSRYWTKRFSYANIYSEGLQCNTEDLKSLWKQSACKFNLVICSPPKKSCIIFFLGLHTEVLLFTNQKSRALERYHKTVFQESFQELATILSVQFFSIPTEFSESLNYLSRADHIQISS